MMKIQHQDVPPFYHFLESASKQSLNEGLVICNACNSHRSYLKFSAIGASKRRCHRQMESLDEVGNFSKNKCVMEAGVFSTYGRTENLYWMKSRLSQLAN
jgi:hypothetical protein